MLEKKLVAMFLLLFFSLCLLQNLNQNPRTLLPKFFGLYCYQVSEGRRLDRNFLLWAVPFSRCSFTESYV